MPADVPDNRESVERSHSADEVYPYSDGKQEPVAELSRGQVFWYSLANLGYGMFYALNNAVLPLFLSNYTSDARIISLMSSSDSIEGVVVQPLIGASSDRLRTRFGRRRPFMLFAVPLSVLLIALTPATVGLPASSRLGGMIAVIVAFTVLFNIAWSPYQAWMPDITPEAQRGRVTAFSTFFGMLGQAGLMLMPLPIPMKFLLCAGVMLATTLLTCFYLREPTHPPATPMQHGPFHEVKEALKGLFVLKQARLAMAVIFLTGVGIGSVFPLLTVFVKKVTGCTDTQAQQMFLVLMVASAVTIIPSGKLTDMFGPKRVLLVGSGLIVIASYIALHANTLGQVAMLLAIAGVGNAAQSAARYPLLTELVPAEEVGFYTGLQATAQSAALPVIAVVTGELVNKGGYRIIFAVCALCLILSMGVLMLIHIHKAKAEVLARNIEQGRASAA